MSTDNTSYFKRHIFFCLNERANGEACCAQHQAQQLAFAIGWRSESLKERLRHGHLHHIANRAFKSNGYKTPINTQHGLKWLVGIGMSPTDKVECTTIR